ncbi:MAG: Acetyl-coenzyme A carboxyl transferase beta chain (EC [uncultured Campylobacterales bacterium]|uniref:Acetyl-coenzyme A carboxylase carboxyl transferase subunit beta n=1 Tax=uncultured Campylobacterales bacterium TaxID=352960 RepID=A0A6S6SB95_9BACT|nr:MAG: Acetyl-coenzyme A carboxyl transferase beta chain (EC [uncultured Campylobacterales bacterium]
MNFRTLFGRDKRSAASSSAWIKCKQCNAMMYHKEVRDQGNVCPKCDFHMRISADDRIRLLSDENTFVEFDTELKPTDPLKFVDSISYKKRISKNNAKTKKFSSIVSGECLIHGLEVQLVVMDFSFMGGSLGSVEGEKILRAIHRGIEKKNPVIIVSASGGARMQESTFSLLQMSKTSAGLKKLSDNGLPYISVLTDPTMGGVSASFAWLGDIIMAEPGALIGFAGPRVIKQTIGADLPDGFQRSEFLLEHGLIDMIVPRFEMKETISELLTLLDNKKTA